MFSIWGLAKQVCHTASGIFIGKVKGRASQSYWGKRSESERRRMLFSSNISPFQRTPRWNRCGLPICILGCQMLLLTDHAVVSAVLWTVLAGRPSAQEAQRQWELWGWKRPCFAAVGGALRGRGSAGAPGLPPPPSSDRWVPTMCCAGPSGSGQPWGCGWHVPGERPGRGSQPPVHGPWQKCRKVLLKKQWVTQFRTWAFSREGGNGLFRLSAANQPEGQGSVTREDEDELCPPDGSRCGLSPLPSGAWLCSEVPWGTRVLAAWAHLLSFPLLGKKGS